MDEKVEIGKGITAIQSVVCLFLFVLIGFGMYNLMKNSILGSETEFFLDGKPLTVKNIPVMVGDTLKTNYDLDLPAETISDLQTFNLSKTKGVRIIETVPSMDTPVCSEQTNDLNTYAKAYTDIEFIVISLDTPFAQSRFCSANNIENIKVLSDYRTGDFSRVNGLLIDEIKLNTRSIIVIDEDDKVLYVEHASEITKPLNLDKAINYVK